MNVGLFLTNLFFRTHWSGMPLERTLSSVRLISDELLPRLRRITSTD